MRVRPAAGNAEPVSGTIKKRYRLVTDSNETAVFAIELAGAFVSDLKGRTCGVQTIDEHDRAPAR